MLEIQANMALILSHPTFSMVLKHNEQKVKLKPCFIILYIKGQLLYHTKSKEESPNLIEFPLFLHMDRREVLKYKAIIIHY